MTEWKGGKRGRERKDGYLSMKGLLTLRLLLIAGTNFSEFSGYQQNR